MVSFHYDIISLYRPDPLSVQQSLSFCVTVRLSVSREQPADSHAVKFSWSYLTCQQSEDLADQMCLCITVLELRGNISMVFQDLLWIRERRECACVRVCVCVSWGAAVCGGWHDLPGQIWCPCLWPDAVEVELIGGRERERELHEAYTAVNRTELRWTWTDEGWQSEELWVLNSYVCAGTEVLDYLKSLSSGKCRASKIFVASFIKMFWNNRIKMACSNFDVLHC